VTSTPGSTLAETGRGDHPYVRMTQHVGNWTHRNWAGSGFLTRNVDILPTDESGGFLNWPELHAATSRVVPAAAGGGLTRAALLPGLARLSR
jgi:hypothetical protein